MAAATSDAFDLQGHRGARGLAPENTLPAFAAALTLGVSTLELDVGVTRDGVVVSDAMQKTRVVKIERVFRHAQYQRVITRSKKLKAHDETNASRVGDRVRIEETRPLSKEKRWRIRAIVSRAS